MKKIGLILILLLLVSTFASFLPQAQAANPSLSSYSLSPTTAGIGQYLTVYYNIYNPNTASVNVGLGFSIRLSGTSGDGLSDPARDIQVSASSGTHQYSRQFLIPSTATYGSYECVWAIWSGAPGSSTQYASSGWQTNRLTIPSASVTFSASGLGSTSGTVLTVNSIVRSVPYTATYTVGQSVSFVWYTPVNDYWSSTTRYDWLSTTGLSAARTGSFVVPSGGGSVTASYATSYQVSFAVSPAGGGTTNPSGVQWFRAGLYQFISASPSSGYSFQSWSKGLFDSISFDNPSSASTWALINGAGTITANFQVTPRVADPSFSPTPGTYTGSVSVTISCATSGAVIHYTTDGTTPTVSSPTYSSPITVSSTTTFYAKAFKSGYIDSNVVPAVYTIAYSVTFSASGLGVTSGTVLVVQGTARSVPYTATYAVGQSVSFEWVNPVYDLVSTTRYEWWKTEGLSTVRSGSFTVPVGGGSVTASYATSYQVSFAVSPSGSGTTSPSGVQWIRAGSMQPISASPASGYSFQSWSKGLFDSISFDNPSSASTNAWINGAGTITANFQQIPTTASVTFSANGLGLLLSGTVLVVQGTPRSVPYTATYTVGQSVSFTWYTPVYDLVSTTRYEWWRTTGLSTVRSGSFTVPSGGGSLTADYATSYQVSFAVSPSGSGSTSPSGVQWFRSGSMQPISASPSPAYDFQGWSKGLLDSISFDSSSSASTYAWIYGAGTITANFVLIASITNIQRPNTAYQQGNTAEVQVFVENTGTVSHSYKAEFFIIGPIGTTKGPYRASGIVMYYESSPGGTTIVSQIIEPGQTGMALMEWLVPQDALAGSYSLEVYVYEYNPILQQEGVFIRSKSELYLFSVDQGYSYSESYTFAFGAKGIHIHVSEEDMNSPVIYGISTSNYLWTSRILGLALVVLDPFAPDLPFAWMNAISIIMNLNDAYLSGQDFGTVIAVGDNGADFLILQFLTLPSAFFYQHDFVWLMNIYHWPDPGIFILFDFTSVTVPGYWIWELPSSTFTISVSAGANGQITPGTGLVNYGSTPTYSITPNTGYHIASITVNGGSVAVTSPKGQSYQFAPVTSAGSIAATFAVDLPSTVIFEDGFESGSFSAWVLPSLTTDETRNIVSNPIHDGSFAAQFSSNGNGGTERAYAYKTISSVNELYSRAYIRVSTFGLVENDDRFYLVIFRAGGASVAFAGWRVVGGVVRWNLIIRHGTGWVNAYSTTTPVLDQWYSVELHWVGDAVAGLGELYVNGVLVCSATGRNTAYYGSASRVDFGLPEIINCAATEVYVDCCAISDSYIGPESAIVPKVATPTFSPAGGTYSSAQLIVIQCATSSATIRYTTDDIEPSSSSTIYSSPILVASTTTIKAKAFKNDMPDSDTATATYTISSSIFEDGFESGSFSAWSLPSLTTGESRNVISSPVHDGSYAAEFASNGNGGTERSYVYTSISSVNELHSRAYIRVSTFGLVENDDRFYLVIFRAGGASVAFAGWRVVGGVVRWNLIIRHGTGWVNAYSTTTPVLDQWYSVELHWVGDAVAGLGELWVDGVNVCSASGRNTAYYGNVNQVWVGLPEIINCAATQIYIDCTVISANYIGLESGPTQVSVNLESLQDTSATSNLGSIVFDVLSYTLPNNVLKTLSSFSVTYVPAGGYLFDHWEVAGGISVENSLSQTTMATVSSAGTLRAIYRIVSSSAIFEDGFESGSFSAWTLPTLTTGETRSVVNTIVYDGSYAGQFSSNGNGGTERAYVYKTFAAQNELYVSGSFRVAASGLIENDDRFYVIAIKSDSGVVAFAGWRVVGGVAKWNLVVRHGTGWVNVYSSVNPVLNQWYDLQLHWKSDATNGLGELYVNGVLVCSSIGKNTANYGSATRVDFGLPELVNCGATEVYGDTCKVSVTPT